MTKDEILKRGPAHFHQILLTYCRNFSSDECFLAKPKYLEMYHSVVAAYGRENVHVISTEELYRNGFGVMTKLFRFLGLPEFGSELLFQKAVNANKYKGETNVIDHQAGLGRTLQPMMSSSRAFIRERIHFDSLERQLSLVTGVKFDWH